MKEAKQDSRTAPELPTLPVWARWKDKRLLLALHVQPGARRSTIVGQHGERLKLCLHAPPVDGKANAELLRFLAQTLQVRPARLELASGIASREKSVALASEAAEVAQLLARLVDCVQPAAPR